MGKHTIIIEATEACRPKRRGIGMQLRTWLEAAPYAEFTNIQFVIAAQAMDNLEPLAIEAPNAQFTIKQAANIGAYLQHLYWLSPDVIFLPRATATYFRDSPVKRVAIDYGMEDFFCRNYIAPRPVEAFLQEHHYAFTHFNSLITVSETSKRDLAWFFPEHKNKLTVIYPGVKHNAEVPEATLPEALINGKYFLTIGYEKRKNIQRVVDAFQAFKKQTSSATKLAVIGQPGYGADELDSYIDSLEVASDIIRLGYIAAPQKQLLLQQCHALLALSLYEGFGISALEGLAAEKIVLASNNSSLKEVVDGAGFLVDPFSTLDIQKQLTRIDTLSSNPKQAAIAKQVERFNATTQSRALFTHLEQVARND